MYFLKKIIWICCSNQIKIQTQSIYQLLTISKNRSQDILTAEFKMNFLRPASGKFLYCISKVLKPGSAIIVSESWVYSVKENCFEQKPIVTNSSLVAKGTFTLACVNVNKM